MALRVGVSTAQPEDIKSPRMYPSSVRRMPPSLGIANIWMRSLCLSRNGVVISHASSRSTTVVLSRNHVRYESTNDLQSIGIIRPSAEYQGYCQPCSTSENHEALHEGLWCLKNMLALELPALCRISHRKYADVDMALLLHQD